MNETNLVYVAVVSVLLGIFKSELGKIFTALGVYLRREFMPGDKVFIMSGATGEWGQVTIYKYKFALSANKRGVYITHADGGGERISLLSWALMRKRPSVKK